MNIKRAKELTNEVIHKTFTYGFIDWCADPEDVAKDTADIMECFFNDDFDYVIHLINNVVPDEENDCFKELMRLIHKLEDLKATYLLHRHDKHPAPIEEHF